MLAKLLPEYGDKVAKPRMKVQLAKNRMEFTGSRVGFDFGVITAAGFTSSGQRSGYGGCDAPILYVGGVGVPSSCGRYNPVLPYPKAYFAARDAQFGTVTVGALQNVNKPASAASATQRGDKAKTGTRVQRGPLIQKTLRGHGRSTGMARLGAARIQRSSRRVVHHPPLNRPRPARTHLPNTLATRCRQGYLFH